MQEKEMKRKLDQELSDVAPDILQNILAKPRVPITDEKELLGDDAPLFKEKKVIRPFAWVTAVAAVIALVVVVVAFVKINNRTAQNSSQLTGNQMAYSIFIDVNPSIEIRVGENGIVEKVKAGNDDAKKIVKKVNKKLKKDSTYEEAMDLVVGQLNKKYLKKKNSAMLVSVASDDDSIIKGKTKEVKKVTDQLKKEKKIKCKTLYQKCVVTDKVEKVAKKNKVSYGKASLCIKIAEKKDSSVNKLCKKKIPELLKKAEKSGVVNDDEESEFDDPIYSGMEMETTEETSEIESVSTEYVEEESTEEELWTDEVDINEGETIGEEEENIAPEPIENPEPVSE